MTQLPLLPVLVPLVTAILMLGLHRAGLAVARGLGFLSVGLLALTSVLLLREAEADTVAVVMLGNWPAPFGISFVADRLSVLMVATTTAIAIPALLSATGGTDRLGLHFHPFFQMQLAGLNGAFLTGDLFNLFVFFEVLLIASYALLAHGGGAARARAGLHYVVLNLVGSVLFLIALGLLYGMLGTLNLADVARRLATVPPEDAALVRTALALLVTVFVLKAALLPLGFWLPHAYPAASAPAAALFAVLTKVGVYALLRLSSIAFDAPVAQGLLQPWLMPVALGTLVVATIGALAAQRLAVVVAHLLVLSTGILAVAIAVGGAPMLGAMLYYLPHTTLVSAALFLMAGRIAEQRGAAEDSFVRGPRLPAAGWLAAGFMALAVAVTGLPPLSGFLGKVMLLTAAPPGPMGYVFWGILIVSGFISALGLARGASAIFWEPLPDTPSPPATEGAGRRIAALLLAVGFVPALVVGAAPLSAYARATAEQVMARQPYLEAVLPRASAP